MKKYFDFYSPLERRYLFNSFLVVVAVVEVIIFLFTLIWQIDEGMFGGPVREVPFPWREYLLVAFAAPIALLLVFGLIIWGFETMAAPPEAKNPTGAADSRSRRVRRFVLTVLGLLAVVLLLWQGGALLAGLAALFKALGLGGTYILAALVGLLCVFITIWLYLNYRLQKRELELRYLQYLAERHGLVLPEGESLSPDRLIPGDGQGSGEVPRLPEAPPPAKDSVP